jgi:tetratricopeptide (TPR) repeat protein
MPKDLNLLIHLGKLELQQERPIDAEKWLRRALAIEKDSEALYALVSVLRMQGRTDEAAQTLKEYEAFKTLLERVNRLLRDEDHATRDAAVAAEIGAGLVQLGKERLGVYWLGRALKRDPAHSPAHQALADFYLRKGEEEKAALHRRLGAKNEESMGKKLKKS